MSTISKTLKFTGGALIGLGVGALTALILAPQSGQVTTAQLRARLDDLTPSKRDDLMRRILKHAAFVTEALQELTRGLPEQALEELERLRDRSRR